MKTLILIALFSLTACAHKSVEKAPAAATEVAPAPPVTTVEAAPIVAVKLKAPKTLKESVASKFRTPAFKERDVYRHPTQTLTFFGLKPDMKVLEIIPGNGWYLEILAPLLNAKGKYSMAIKIPPTGEPQSKSVLDWSKMHPEIADDMSTVNFDLSNPEMELGMDGSVDMVLTFRNVHNWMAKNTQDTAFKAFFKVLKKGGTLGVVEHRAPEDRTDPLAPTGYVRQSDLIAMAEKAGFKLAAKSEINANKKDTKDYAQGVWTLPPTYTLKEVDHAKYAAIGESDRMTLKFIKP